VKSSVKLAPDKNRGCLKRARRELMVAREARDVMLELVTMTLASGGSCNPEDASTPDAWTRLENTGGRQQPLLLNAWRTTRRWVRDGVRALRAKVVQHSPWLVVAGAIAIQALAVLGLV
jgi:hypothetical protein